MDLQELQLAVLLGVVVGDGVEVPQQHIGRPRPRYFDVRILDTWRSKASGAVYPSGWQIKIPLLGIDVEVTSNLPDQEMQTSASTGVTYWEGSVSVKGVKGGSPIEGQGYVELTGYAGPFSALK